jgi:hypothetical protein
MALESLLRAHSVWGRVRVRWMSFSGTVIGDIVATAVAIGGVAALFVASSFVAVGLARAFHLVLRLLGAA